MQKEHSPRWVTMLLVLAGIVITLLIVLAVVELASYVKAPLPVAFVKVPTPKGQDNLPKLNMYAIEQSLNALEAKQSVVYALRASDGTQRWYYTAEGGITLLDEVDGRVFIKTAYKPTPDEAIPLTSSLIVLQASDGKLLWHYQAAEKMVDEIFGPFVDSGAVYFATSVQPGHNMVSALRASDGKALWQYQIPGTSNTWLTDFQENNGLIYFATGEGPLSYNDSVYALRVSDKTLLWKNQLSNEPGRLYIGVFQSGVYVKQVFADPTSHTTGTSLVELRLSDGKVLWQHIYSAEFSQLQENNGVIYTIADSLVSSVYAVRARDGAVLWYKQTDRPISQINISNGVVYFSSNSSLIDQYQNRYDVLVEALRANNGTTLWQHTFVNQDVTVGTPGFVLTNEAIYVTTHTTTGDTVNVLKVSDGTPLRNYQSKSASDVSQVLVQDGRFYLGTRGDTSTVAGIDGTSGGSICTYQANDGSKVWCHQTEVGVSWFVLA